MFVTGAALLPVSIASYSLVGEKVERSLEPRVLREDDNYWLQSAVE